MVKSLLDNLIQSIEDNLNNYPRKLLSLKMLIKVKFIFCDTAFHNLIQDIKIEAKMVINKSSLLLGLNSLINPVIGFLHAIYLILSKSQVNSFFTALNISIIYTYMPLLWDTISNFYYVKFFYNTETANPYQKLISILIDSFNFQYIYIIFGFTFLISYIALNIVSKAKLTNKKNITYKNILLLMAILLCLDYRNLMDLQKFTLASYLCTYAILNLESNISKFFVLITSALLHPFMIAFVIVYLFLKRVKHNKTYMILFFTISLFGFLIVPLITEYIIQGISPKAYTYLTEYDTSSRYSSKYSELIIYLCRLSLVFFVLYLLSKLKNTSLRTYKLTFTSLLVLMILSNNAIFFERSFIFFALTAAVYIISSPLSKKQTLTAIAVVGLNLSLNIFWMTNVVFSDKYQGVYNDSSTRYQIAAKPFYFPTLLLFDIETHGYNDDKIIKTTYIR